jgi:hypothetical protein
VMALAQRPIVDAQHPGRRSSAGTPLMQAAQQRISADADPQTGGQPGSGFASQSVADLVEGLGLVAGAPGIIPDQGGETFGEDRGSAVGLVTEEAAEAQLETNRNAVPG